MSKIHKGNNTKKGINYVGSKKHINHEKHIDQDDVLLHDNEFNEQCICCTKKNAKWYGRFADCIDLTYCDFHYNLYGKSFIKQVELIKRTHGKFMK